MWFDVKPKLKVEPKTQTVDEEVEISISNVVHYAIKIKIIIIIKSTQKIVDLDSFPKL